MNDLIWTVIIWPRSGGAHNIAVPKISTPGSLISLKDGGSSNHPVLGPSIHNVEPLRWYGNFWRRPTQCRGPPIRLNSSGMPDRMYLRKWAAQVARQAGEEPDAAESRRLLSIAEYWVRLADSEESKQPLADLGD